MSSATLLTRPPEPAKDTAASLTLFDIERALVDLLSEYEECQNDDERTNVQNAIEAYVAAEVEKVDGVRAYLRHSEIMAAAAQQEAERFRERAKAWQSRADRLKDACLRIMSGAGKKKLEGRTGALLVKGNGGLAPLVITDETMIPEECVVYTGKIAGPLWLRTLKQCPWMEAEFAGSSVQMKREVNNGLVREALAKGPVAGAFLTDREKHLEVK